MTPSGTAIALGFVLCLAAAPAFAQDELTLDRAIRDALARNAALRAARAGAAEAAEHVGAARAEWLPRLSFTESWQRGDQPVFVFSSLLASRQFTAANFAIDALNHPDSTGFFRSSIGAEQLLFDGGRRRAAVQSARLRSDISTFGSDEAAAALVSSTTETYGRILIAEAATRAAQAALQAALEDVARAERRRDAGMATDADVLALAAQVTVLRQREIDSEADAAVARAELNRLTGAPIERIFQALEPTAGLEPATLTLSLALADADMHRPELRRAQAVIDLAASERSGARAALIPQVAAQAAYEFNGLSFTNRASSWILGGEVRWNFSLGGADLARSRAASHAQTRATAEAEDARARVRVEVVTAFRRLESARARQAVGRAAVTEARERQRIIRDRFEAGVAGVTDVLQASSALTEAEAQRIAALVDAMNSEALLRRAIGRTP